MYLNIPQQKQQKETISYRCFKEYNPESYNRELMEKLENSQITSFMQENNVNGATEELVKVMQVVANIHAPVKEITIGKEKKKAKWFSDELTQKITEKNNFLTDYFTTGFSCFKDKATKLKNEINHMKRKLKTSYYTEKISEVGKDSKKLWTLLKEVTGTTKTKEKVEPDSLTQEKANNHNTFFATVGTRIQSQLNVQTHQTDFTGQKGFGFEEESIENIIKIIDRIKSDVATGSDTINARLVKDAKQIIAPIITNIINIGYKTSSFPDCMKVTIIKPIHKKDSTDDIANYRPISILPTLSKIFERSASDQMLNFLESQKKISNSQHAYRKKHSTTTCLVEVLNRIYKFLDMKMWVAIVSLDLSKAFDSISHSLLLHKLAKLGMHENCINWVKSYLQNRKQVTKFKSFTSEEETITPGIPQGSIIGPLLFICYTNDLSDEFEDCQIYAYADDTQLITEAKNLNQLKRKVENIIKTAQKWYESNSMKNNIDKTEVLILNPGREKPKLKIVITNEGQPIVIKSKEVIKVLGVKIDQQLNWKNQVNSTKKKAMNSIRNLNRVNSLLPKKLRVQLYKSLIEPIFSYADVAWGGCGIVNANSLQLAQNFAARSILGMKKSDSATTALKKLNFLNLKQRRLVHETVFAHKSILNAHPTTLNQIYQQQQSTANTRSATRGKLNVPKHRTSKYEDSPFYRTLTAWNAAPTELPIGDVKKHKAAFQQLLIRSTH